MAWACCMAWHGEGMVAGYCGMALDSLLMLTQACALHARLPPRRSLGHLPLYGLGVSSGASFVLKLPRYFKASLLLHAMLCGGCHAVLCRDMPCHVVPCHDAATRFLLQHGNASLLPAMPCCPPCSSAASFRRLWASTPSHGPWTKWMGVSCTCASASMQRQVACRTGLPACPPPPPPPSLPPPPLPLPADYPPTIFVSMVKDQTQGAKISNDYSILKQRGSPVAIIKVLGS